MDIIIEDRAADRVPGSVDPACACKAGLAEIGGNAGSNLGQLDWRQDHPPCDMMRVNKVGGVHGCSWYRESKGEGADQGLEGHGVQTVAIAMAQAGERMNAVNGGGMRA